MGATGAMAYEKPGPRQASHALLPSERTAVKDYAGREDTVDYSLMVLSIKAAEAGYFILQRQAYVVFCCRKGFCRTDGISTGRGLYKNRTGQSS